MSRSLDWSGPYRSLDCLGPSRSSGQSGPTRSSGRSGLSGQRVNRVVGPTWHIWSLGPLGGVGCWAWPTCLSCQARPTHMFHQVILVRLGRWGLPELYGSSGLLDSFVSSGQSDSSGLFGQPNLSWLWGLSCPFRVESKVFGLSGLSNPCGSSSSLTRLSRRACLVRFGSWARLTRLCRQACSVCLDRLVGLTRMDRRTSPVYLGHLGRLGPIDISNIEQWVIPKIVKFQFPSFLSEFQILLF